MSEIKSVLTQLNGTEEEEILREIENRYENVAGEQKDWYEKSQFFCPEGCGECCRNFEPDLLECEALYMAAWLLENQPSVADDVAEGKFPFSENKGCRFWNENNPYHCTIYGGRAFICRLFGASGFFNKSHELVWKPCKFYPVDKLTKHNPPLAHKQYSAEQIMQIFGVLPPSMSDLMEETISIEPDEQKTSLIHDILPETIRRLKWIISLNNDDNSVPA